MIKVFGAAVSVLFVAFAASACAAPPHYYLSPSGNDAADCSSATPCMTPQHTVDICPETCAVSLAAGVYHAKTNVLYRTVITFEGTVGPDGTCKSASDVIIDDGDHSGVLFWSQDHAITILRCLTLAAYANGSMGLATRQGGIADADHVNCMNFPGGMCFAATEASKINIASAGIYGGGSYWASATDGSQITIGGDIKANGPAFSTALVMSAYYSIMNFRPSRIDGGIGGAGYECIEAIVKNAEAIPGGPFAGNKDCRLY